MQSYLPRNDCLCDVCHTRARRAATARLSGGGRRRGGAWPRIHERQLDDLRRDRRLANADPRTRRGLAAQEREGDRAELGRARDRADAADAALAEVNLHASERGRRQPQATEMTVGLAPVVEARDRLLA